MRTTLLAVSILAVAFAGCTEEPPSGEFSSTGNALTLTGQVESFESDTYNNPYAETGGSQAECAQNDDQVPEQVPIDECDWPYTTMMVNFSAMPDPSGGTYAIEWYNSAQANNEDIGALNNVHQHPTTGDWMGEYAFDNTDDCDGSTDDMTCDKTQSFDMVRLLLDDIIVATAGLSGGSSFELNDTLLQTSFSATYSGKDLVLTVSGASTDLAYEAWLVSTDEEGVVNHDESFDVVDGENEITATKNIEDFSHVHIHVKGTKLNVAVSAVA